MSRVMCCLLPLLPVFLSPLISPFFLPPLLFPALLYAWQVWPYLKVRRALYRFRVLGAANTRFFNLRFICTTPRNYPHFTPPFSGDKLPIIVVRASHCDLPLFPSTTPCHSAPMYQPLHLTNHLCPCTTPTSLRPSRALHACWIVKCRIALHPLPQHHSAPRCTTLPRIFPIPFLCTCPPAHSSPPPPSTHQIGSDGGYLPRPAVRTSLLVAPAERYDILVDFSSLRSSSADVILTNDAPAPFPAGEPVTNDTTVVMRFIVDHESPRLPAPRIPKSLVPVPPVDTSRVVVERWITAVEETDPATGQSIRLLLGDLPYSAPPTETPQEVSHCWGHGTRGHIACGAVKTHSVRTCQFSSMFPLGLLYGYLAFV
ncbi:unnamed protein product [Closterium sp. Yama58-4]|nr:unnamed protein product [Closterium sp. Yama58-4]